MVKGRVKSRGEESYRRRKKGMVRGGRERKDRERVMERVGWSSPNTEKGGAREGE